VAFGAGPRLTPYVIHEEAKFEAGEAAAYYRERNPQASEQFALQLQAAIQRIRAHPQSFPRVGRAYRRAIVQRFPYLVYFKDKPEVVEIFAITHGKRKPFYWAGRSF
jgi:toxin ParE1/3/4